MIRPNLTDNRSILCIHGHKCGVFINWLYSKTQVKWPLSKRQKIGFQDQLWLYAGQKYCRMLQGKHSVILLTCIKLPFVIKIFVSSIFEWPFYTGFTVKHLAIDVLYSKDCGKTT